MWRTAEVLARQRSGAVSPEPSLLVHTHSVIMEEGSVQKVDIYAHLIAAYNGLKINFT